VKQKTFLSVFVFFFFALKAELQVLNFVRLSWGRTMDKLQTNWQNIAQVGLQLKFAFRMQLLAYEFISSVSNFN